MPFVIVAVVAMVQCAPGGIKKRIELFGSEGRRQVANASGQGDCALFSAQPLLPSHSFAHPTGHDVLQPNNAGKDVKLPLWEVRRLHRIVQIMAIKAIDLKCDYRKE